MTDEIASLGRIETAQVSLRLLRMRDAAAMALLTDDIRITSAVSFLPATVTLDAARRLLDGADGRRDGFFGAWRRSDGMLVGVVGGHLHDDVAVEIGYWIGVAFQRHGYALEAAGAFVAELRRRFPGRRVVAECRVENLASWRVLERLRFYPTGEPGTRPGRVRLAFTPE